MKKELDEYLVKKYPKIFENRNASIKKSSMAFGFDHSDGWFWILDQLCDSIQRYIDNNNQYRKPEDQISQVVADQVKEKFGYLNFYCHGGDRYTDGMIALAEFMSRNVCERCGTTENVGHTRGPWIFTICKDCYDKDERLAKENFIWTVNDDSKISSTNYNDSTKEMLHDIISWEKDLSEYESLETILRSKYKISKK